MDLLDEKISFGFPDQCHPAIARVWQDSPGEINAGRMTKSLPRTPSCACRVILVYAVFLFAFLERMDMGKVGIQKILSDEKKAN